LNDSRKFISALGQLVLEALGEAGHSRVSLQGTGRTATQALVAAD